MWRMTRKLPDNGRPHRADQIGRVDEELTREAIGAYYYVYNTMGYGFVEPVYGKALYIDLRRRGLRVEREVTVTAFSRSIRWVISGLTCWWRIGSRSSSRPGERSRPKLGCSCTTGCEPATSR